MLSVLALGATLAFSASIPKPATSAAKSKPSVSTTKKVKKGVRRSKRSARRRGQNGIQPERARQIQAALIRQNYLEGAPTGVWDEPSKAAMRRYQGDNGWQTKVIPDSRALIKLGLGPDQSALLNPDTAATHLPPQAELAPGGGTSQQ